MNPVIGRLQQFHLALGTAPLGNLFAPISEPDAQGAIDTAWRAGIRAYDTAPHYGNGLAEHRLGHRLRTEPRDSFVLSTKVGRLLVPDASAPRDQHGYVGVLPFRQVLDYSYDGALRSIEASLQRLGLARIDIAYIHDIDRYTHGEAQPGHFRAAMEGAAKALFRLRSEGVLGAVGLGVNDAGVCVDALAHGDFDIFLVAGRYTLLDQSANGALLPACLARGARVMLGGPYNSGILAAAPGAAGHYDYHPASPEIVRRVQALHAACGRFGVPLKAAALQFPRAHPAVATVLFGARSAAEVTENLAMAVAPIPPEFWSELVAGKLLPQDVPLPGQARP